MAKITVNAYDERHPDHQRLVNYEADSGADIILLPDFEVEIEWDEQDEPRSYAR
mgnify:CR=1 FL=1